MARQPDQSHGDPVVAAIERVLKVERDGIKALRDSQQEAGRLMAEARAQAAAIAQRADACISRLHAAYLQKLERDIAALGAARPNDGDNDARIYDRATLEAAARRVAARLTGAS